MLRRVLWVIAALGWVTLSAQGETIAERAFTALRDQPPLCPDAFDFVVVGDNRDELPIVQPEIFKQAIREWNILQPSFVVNVGDLILGGGSEGLATQWDEFDRVVRECRVPFIPVPGNHDVSDAVSEKIYTERTGPLTFAFSFGNSRFIVLNTEEIGAVDRLSPSQLDWLKNELEATQAKNIFIFLHKPYFASDWDKSWAEVAALFPGKPVRAVFAGHLHYYQYWGERDGVHYIITGGGGSPLHAEEEEGGFFHYLWVRVRDTSMDWAVIRTGHILPKDSFTAEGIQEMRRVRESFFTEPLEVPWQAPLDRSFYVHIQNVRDVPLTGKLVWSCPPGWTIEPLESTYTVDPQQRGTLVFTVKAGVDAVRFPVPTFHTEVPSVNDSAKPLTVTRALDLVPVLTVPMKTANIDVDGDVADWKDVPRYPLPYPHNFDPTNTADLQAWVRFQWSPEGLYLLGEIEDDEFYQPYSGDITWSADNLELFLDDWEWGLSLTPKGEEVFLYTAPGREEETVNHAVHLAVRRAGRSTRYEAFFPASELPPNLTAPNSSCRFSMIANDLDAASPERGRHWLELTPGAGSGRPGFPRVKLVLAPAVTAE
jgi:hypothetical protein